MKFFPRVRLTNEERSNSFQLFTNLNLESDHPIVDMEGIIKSVCRGNIDLSSNFKLDAYNWRTEENNRIKRNRADYISKNFSISFGSPSDEFDSLTYTAEEIHAIRDDRGLSSVSRHEYSHRSVDDEVSRSQIGLTVKHLTARYKRRGVNLPVLLANATQGYRTSLQYLGELVNKDSEVRDLVRDLVYQGTFDKSLPQIHKIYYDNQDIQADIQRYIDEEIDDA